MNNLFRGLLAGYGAKKLGGGCFSTILIFIVLWVLLGQCGSALPPRDVDVAPPAPAVERVEAPVRVGPPLAEATYAEAG